MRPDDKTNLKGVFGVKFVDKTGVYLGANMDFTLKKGSIFAQSLDRIKNNFSLWKAPLLSLASRLVLVKHVILSVPSYLLSVFKSPVYFLDKIRSTDFCFLWFGEKDKGLVWKSWVAFCIPKGKGGFGD